MAEARAAVGEAFHEIKEYKMLKSFRPALALLVALVILTAVPGCGYNALVSQSEAVDAGWGEVENQLQRRNDLIPNLVSTVKGFAKQEKDVLIAVTEARSRVAGAGTPKDPIKASNQIGRAHV